MHLLIRILRTNTLSPYINSNTLEDYLGLMDDLLEPVISLMWLKLPWFWEHTPRKSSYLLLAYNIILLFLVTHGFVDMELWRILLIMTFYFLPSFA